MTDKVYVLMQQYCISSNQHNEIMGEGPVAITYDLAVAEKWASDKCYYRKSYKEVPVVYEMEATPQKVTKTEGDSETTIIEVYITR